MLAKLLTSPLSRRTSPIKRSSLENPPDLPERAVNKASDEVRLLGPFSKRRESNIRRRYFIKQISSVYVPLEMERQISGGESDQSGRLLNTGLGKDVIEQIERLTGSARTPPLPRRERKLLDDTEKVSRCFSGKTDNNNQNADAELPTRWLRRRYRELLHTVPLVTHEVTKAGQTEYDISLPSRALGDKTKTTSLRTGIIKQTDLEWIEKATEIESAYRQNKMIKKK